jgi:altronate dehydratase large subunit
MSEFLGYHRTDGRIGVRNHLLVLSTGGLTGPTARRIGQAIAGAVTVTMPYGVGLMGRDQQVTLAAIVGLACHPNVGATLLIGDNPKMTAEIAAVIAARGQRHAALTMDDCGQDAITLTERGLHAGARLARDISGLRRAPAPLSALTIGLECGRSDPSSGLIANPLLGLVSDAIVDAGGRSIIGETMEWLGAEHLLARRARTPDVAAAIRDAVLAREQLAIAAGVDLTGSNPSPTNIAGGLSSIEEKSLGNIAKSGTRPIEGLIAYGETPPGPGLWVMDAPAYAPESVTGFVMAGAQLVLFTTGVGNSYVSALAPTLKVSANPETCTALGQQLDFDASAAFLGRSSLDEQGAQFRRMMIETASGQMTWGEVLREGDEVVSRFGPAL